MKLKPKYKCDCWVCDPLLRSIGKKINKKEFKYLEHVVNLCIHAEMELDYLEMKRKGKFK